MRTSALLLLALGLLLSACATVRPAPAPPRAAVHDAPAIWVDPRDGARGVIIGTDREAGIGVYDLGGRPLQVVAGGRPGAVDLRGGFPTPAGERVLVAASDRDRPGAALYLLDPATLELSLWTEAPIELAEPNGLCLARRGEAFLLIVSGADGQVRQLSVAAGADGRPRLSEERRFAVAARPEGCVADDGRGQLYLGEEGRGVWRFDLGAGEAEGELIAEAPSQMLMPDVEGLALLDDERGTWLIASSRGDSAFAVWNVGETRTVYHGLFSVVAGSGIDAVTGADGVAAQGRLLGAFPAGLVVDEGSPGARQTFRLVAWAAVKEALGL